MLLFSCSIKREADNLYQPLSETVKQALGEWTRLSVLLFQQALINKDHLTLLCTSDLMNFFYSSTVTPIIHQNTTQAQEFLQSTITAGDRSWSNCYTQTSDPFLHHNYETTSKSISSTTLSLSLECVRDSLLTFLQALEPGSVTTKIAAS